MTHPYPPPDGSLRLTRYRSSSRDNDAEVTTRMSPSISRSFNPMDSDARECQRTLDVHMALHLSTTTGFCCIDWTMRTFWFWCSRDIVFDITLREYCNGVCLTTSCSSCGGCVNY
ncbi:hypothetical protein EDB85DRAFT_1977551 [Lactarius pseudohatsudake]|nr:hypothetical protein EDB85DRAFT_1977551 [Lactarius pseudohatsudake]